MGCTRSDSQATARKREARQFGGPRAQSAMSTTAQPVAPSLLFRSTADEVVDIWRQPPPVPIPSGIAPLDRALNGGFLPESLAVLCAGTGRGKSGLVVQIALGWLAQGRSVLFIETEMSKRQTFARFLAQRMMKPWREVFSMAPQSADQLAELAQSHLHALHVVRWERSQDIGQILDGCPRYPSGPPLVVVDQISDLARARDTSDMRIATAQVTGALKLFAEKHQTLILAVSQTARAVTAGQGRPRSGRDFEGAAKDAGEVEADAGTLIYLESEPCPADGFGTARLHISKNRGGACDVTVGLRFHGAIGYFEPDPIGGLSAAQLRVLDAIRESVGSNGITGIHKLKPAVGMGQDALARVLESLDQTGHIERDKRGIRLVNSEQQP